MTVYAIIPARGGSKRIPRKNIREFYGKPILAYSIETLLKLPDMGRNVYVSTEDREIARVAEQYGAIALDRDPELAGDEVSTRQVMVDAINLIGIDVVALTDVVVCMYPCAPLVTADHVYDAVQFLHYSAASYVVSVGADPLRDAGAFYAASAWGWLCCAIFSRHTRLAVLPDERVCDVNTEADWRELEEKYANLRRGLH